MLSRTGRVVVLLSLLVLALRVPDVGTTTGSLASPRFPTALGGGLELVLLAVCAWTAVLGMLTLPGGPLARRACRLLPRTLVAAGAVGVLAVAPAGAAEGPRPLTSLDGLVLPDRPVGGSASAPPVGTPPPDRHVVRPGDTLWSIAADRLDADAPVDRVAALTAELHDRNRAVLGDDPDLIRPGQRLELPEVGA